ncbi:MAG: hypothetical protein AAF560_08010 [Acidobacteriota bacterium]
MSASRWPLAAIFALAVVLRGLPFWLHQWTPEHVTIVDSTRYLELAERLLAGYGFSLPHASGADVSELFDVPEVFRTPGYPLVLAAASWLPGSQLVWVLGLQVVAGILLVALGYWLVASWAGHRAGLAAALLLALDPAHVVYANLLMADILAAAAVGCGLATIELASRRKDAESRPEHRRTLLLLAAGACLTVATALRPVAALLWLPAAVFLKWRGVGLRAVAVFAAAALLFPLAWSARNAQRTEEWTLSTAFDVNLALVAAAKVEARHTGVTRAAGERAVLQRVAELQGVSVSESPGTADFHRVCFHHACREVGLETLRRAPRATAAEVFASAVELMFAGERRYLYQVLGRPLTGPGLGDVNRQLSDVVGTLSGQLSGAFALVVQAIVMAGVWVLAALGARVLWRQRRFDLLFLLVTSVFVVLAPSLVVASGRLRIPISLVIYALAGIGAARLWPSGISPEPSALHKNE